VTIPASISHAIQKTQEWLKELSENGDLADSQEALSVLRAVLHHLRDRLTMDEAVDLGAQLPTIVRGIYYEGWHHAATPTKDRHLEYFVDDIFRQLPPQFPVDPLKVVRGIFEILWEKLDPGEFDKLMGHLPVSLRDLREPAT